MRELNRSNLRFARTRVWQWLAATLAALAYCLTWGFNHGVDNQNVYLLQALRLNDPSLLQRDWYTAQVTHYHPAFAHLAAPLLRLSPSGWGIAIGLCVSMAVGALGWHAVLRRLERQRLIALAAFFLVLVFMHATLTLSVAVSYIFNQAFQPSALGSLGLLLAVAPFLARRWLLSGILMALSGLFHANYLVLNVAAFGLAHLFIGGSWREIAKRVSLQVGPSLVPLAILAAPMFATVASPEDAREAQRILFELRAPHHYVPKVFQRDLVLTAGWLCLGASLTGLLGKSRALRLLELWMLAAALVIFIPTLITSIEYVPRVAQLFVWRLAPFVDLAGQSVFCLAALRVAWQPRLLARLPLRAWLAFAASGLVLCSAYALRNQTQVTWAILCVVVFTCLCWGGQALWRGLSRLGASGRARFLPVLKGLYFFGAPALCLAFFLRPELSELEARSNLLSGVPKQERELLDWVQANTTRDALFLSPPEHPTFRFAAQRAIVVDWKASPMLPAEVLEWHRRLSDVTGRRFGGYRDLEGYRDLSLPRAKNLRERYGFDYVLVPRHNRHWSAQAPLFKNGVYAIYDARVL